MPRQTFLAKESFVDAPEKAARDAILALPAYSGQIRLVQEKYLVHCYRFVCGPSLKNVFYHIDVSILPLNAQYTRVSLHASYLNGQSFYTDSDMAFVLHEFESAVHASVKGELVRFTSPANRKEQNHWWHQFITFFRSMRTRSVEVKQL
jgi:hypothetical protein